jgi:ribose transport system ATP-binding protein
MNENILEVRHLDKSYPGVRALQDVSLDVRRNTVHCIVGENGAGKSTFIKILTCAEERTGGQIHYRGREYRPRSIREAMNEGISTLFQELNVVNQLTVEQNLTLGREKSWCGVLRKSDPTERVFRFLRDFAPDIPLQAKVSSLSYAEKQVLEIVKAFGVEANLIIMDEPTAALSEAETKRLFSVIRDLKNRQITVIYISHILDDIFSIGDYVTVFRDGRVISTSSVAEIGKEELIRMMIGKAVSENYVPRPAARVEKVLEVRGLTTGKLRDISFDLHKGEIIGFYGLRGAGKSEIGYALYGLDAVQAGSIRICGRPARFALPRDSLRRGIAMIPEERLSEGIITKLPIRANISITNLRKLATLGVVSAKRERQTAEKYARLLSIKARSIEQRAATLSGGNQQKVVVSKFLNAESSILIMDEPTRGIDVGAKEEIHKIIRDLAGEGVSIMIFSSEYPEIVNLCDRIFLLSEGEIIQVLDNRDADAERIMHLITRGKRNRDQA